MDEIWDQLESSFTTLDTASWYHQILEEIKQNEKNTYMNLENMWLRKSALIAHLGHNAQAREHYS